MSRYGMAVAQKERKPRIRSFEEAVAACRAAGQNPSDYTDYADLRRGKQNWEYFLEDWSAWDGK